MGDNVYYNISFSSIPRDMAERIREAAEQEIEGTNISFSISIGEPIGSDDPTPIADEAADAVDPTTPSAPLSAPVDTPLSVVPDVEPTQA